MDKLNEIARQVRGLTTEYRDYAEGGYNDGAAVGWHLMILNEIQQLNSKIEAVQRQVDRISEKLDNIQIKNDGQIEKTDLMKQLEKRFQQSIGELLDERKYKSVREIASEFGIAKSTIALWLKGIK